MAQYKIKPTIVKAERIIGSGILETSYGVVVGKTGDYVVSANDKIWVVEGDVFDLLYEPIEEVVKEI